MITARCALSLLLFQTVSQAAERVPFQFITTVAHWDAYDDPAYLDVVNAARPDVAQVGFYGGHFRSLAHTPQYAGYPAHFPVQGLAECGAWLARLKVDLHARGVKVIGHFNMKFLVGDPQSETGPRGFFKFYRELWDETTLGPKPVEDPVELLEKDVSGNPIVNHTYNDEKPLPVSGIKADIVLPTGLQVTGLEAMIPEAPDPVSLPIDLQGGRVRFAIPEFLVYCIVRVRPAGP
jgi:hypothetical protein